MHGGDLILCQGRLGRKFRLDVVQVRLRPACVRRGGLDLGPGCLDPGLPGTCRRLNRVDSSPDTRPRRNRSREARIRSVVLAVDDDPRILRLVRVNLERAGFAVEITASGRDALKILAERPPDLLVLDLMLPQVDGIEICRAARANDKTAAMPIIMLTARVDESEAARAGALLGEAARELVESSAGRAAGRPTAMERPVTT